MNNSKKARTIKPSTEKKLFALSKNQCYHPNCTKRLITNDKKDILAKIAHIEAASSNGPRFNPNMTDDERRDFNNLILLCDEHHIEIDHHPKEYPTELLQEWKLLHEGTDTNTLFSHILKNKYLNNFKTISLLTNTSKPINDIEEFINLAIIKEREEKEDEKKLIKRELILNSYEEIHKPKEPIAIKELINTSKKSLIYGKAGIGKTTLCKYISYKWAKGEIYKEFEYIIYLPLREWKNGGIKGAIKDYYYSLDEKELNIDFNAYKILFLFDGYDELDSDKKKDLRDEIDKYALSHYIITTRPYGYQKSDFRVDEYFETIGFTNEDVEKYIDAFFKENNDKAKSLKAYLETNINIKHIGYIPLMLEMICSQWEQKEFSESLTMTELYSQVVEDILNRYSAQKDDKRVYKRKNRKKIKEQLGKLAFRGLTKQTILFDGDFIENSVDDIFFEENVIYSGFLKSDAKEKDLLDNCFEFLHLTFQEYFSALYVSMLSKEEQSEIIRDWKFYPHMQMFFAFLGGLIGDKEFLLREIESEPRDLIGFHEFSSILICASEMRGLSNNRKNNLFELFFYWLDFFIENNLNYNEFILEKIVLYSNLVEDIFIDKLLNLIKKNNIENRLNESLVIGLVFLTKSNNQKVINTFLNLIENGKLPKYFSKDGEDCQKIYDYESIAIALVDFSKNNKKVFNKLIYYINNTNIDYNIQDIIIKSLTLLFYDKDINIKKIINERDWGDEYNRLIWLKEKALIAKEKNIYNIDKNFIINVIAFIENGDIDVDLRNDVALYLSFLAKNDDEISNALINFIKSSEDIYNAGEIAQTLAFVGINDNVIVDKLINKIKEISYELGTHSFDILDDTVEALLSLNLNNDNLIIDFTSFRENNKSDGLWVESAINHVLDFLEKKDAIVNDEINDNDIKEDIKNNIDEKYQDSELITISTKVLIDFLDDDKISLYEKEEFINMFASLDEVDEVIMDDVIIYFLTNEKFELSYRIISFEKFLKKSYKILEKIDIKKYFPKVINFKNISSKVFFDAFDNNFISLNVLIEHIQYKTLSLYINMEHKLCTIENGELIKSEREVDKNILNILPDAKESLKQQFLEKRKNTKLTPKALIITEGKTDWKHLKKALERFQIFYDEYIDLNIEFFEYERMGMGEARVSKRIEVESFIDRHFQEQNKQKILHMFDRDTKYSKDYRDKEFVKPIDKEFKKFLETKLESKYKSKSKKYKEIKDKLDKGFYSDIDEEFHKILTGEEYKEWQRLSNSNVYVFCIPKINDELNEICIEFYYKQDEVKKAFDNGKRLFYGSEFDKESEFDKDSISYCKKYKTTKRHLKPLDILDGDGDKKVYLINDKKKQNIALSKNEFTQNILDEVEGFDSFDIENFRLIFDVIRKIVND